ncbi:hypothetical protein HDU97_005953 [Phlyctochytrium planicorne]|nr:hypothetical protein HDU97_005953 [Phlyctochytrium planicorne]
MVGVVEVKIVKAWGLNKKDMFTQNDAFVEFWLNDKSYKQRTSVIQSSQPEWNQVFTLNWEKPHDTLHFHVLDKDLIGTDGIGYCKFDFGHLKPGQSEYKEMKLRAHALDLTPNGHLLVQVTVRSA